MLSECENTADPFVYTNSVTQIVGLFIGGKTYKLTNIQEPVDYFRYKDDASIFKISPCSEVEIESAFTDMEQIISFSEEIEIQRGYHLIESFRSTDHFLDGWDDGIEPECSRDIITIQ